YHFCFLMSPLHPISTLFPYTTLFRSVKIDNFSFMPRLTTVRTGTEVTWLNQDDIPHNVIATKKSFTSPVLDTGEKFSHTFTEPGKFSYYCSLHPHMTGEVVARES